MKYLSKIQSEFTKIARTWNELSLEEQKSYLQRHPKSKRRLTATPGSKQEQQIDQVKQVEQKVDTKTDQSTKETDNRSTKQKIKDMVSGIADRARHNKEDDSYTFKRSFFYRHGMTAEKFANAIKTTASKLGLDAEVVKFEEKWHAWPRDSWFEATLKFKEKSTENESKPIDIKENLEQKREEINEPKIKFYNDYEVPQGDYKLKRDMDVWIYDGMEPTNAYYGNAQISRPKYKKITAPKESKVRLGNYSEQYITIGDQQPVKVKFKEPEQKGEFEKSYGNTQVAIPIDDLEKLS